MNIRIREMKKDDWQDVADIYTEGIKTKRATFQTEAPTFEEWDEDHLKECRLLATNHHDEVLGWVALSPVSNRCVFLGVAEVSIYIGEQSRGKKVGEQLLKALITESEEAGIWLLQSGIFEVNKASITLHEKCGFRVVGVREKMGCDAEGNWKDVILMERRSKQSRFN